MAVRGLSRSQAESGHIPAPLIRKEWKAMHMASLYYQAQATYRSALALEAYVAKLINGDLPPSDR